MGEGSHVYGNGSGGSGRGNGGARKTPGANSKIFQEERRKRAAERLRQKGDINAGYSQAEINTLTKEENRSAGLKTERGAIISNLGTQLFRSKSGTSNRTKLPTIFIRGNTFTHNHPNANTVEGIGSSFSGQDIMVAARNGAKGARVGSGNYTYDIKPGKNGWGDANSINRDWNKVADRLTIEMYDYVNKGKTRQEKLTRMRRANTLISHIATREVAQKYGLKYTRRKAR